MNPITVVISATTSNSKSNSGFVTLLLESLSNSSYSHDFYFKFRCAVCTDCDINQKMLTHVMVICLFTLV